MQSKTVFWSSFKLKLLVSKPISIYPQCSNDISFWIKNYDEYNSNRFFDIVRECGGDFVEQVDLIDKFYHPKTKLNSHSYRITYRSMERTLTQQEVNAIHKKIESNLVKLLNVTIR
jgi:phenylalanyl-tRNA synthetase alpha chain